MAAEVIMLAYFCMACLNERLLEHECNSLSLTCPGFQHDPLSRHRIQA